MKRIFSFIFLLSLFLCLNFQKTLAQELIDENNIVENTIIPAPGSGDNGVLTEEDYSVMFKIFSSKGKDDFLNKDWNCENLSKEEIGKKFNNLIWNVKTIVSNKEYLKDIESEDFFNNIESQLGKVIKKHNSSIITKYRFDDRKDYNLLKIFTPEELNKIYFEIYKKNAKEDLKKESGIYSLFLIEKEIETFLEESGIERNTEDFDLLKKEYLSNNKILLSAIFLERTKENIEDSLNIWENNNPCSLVEEKSSLETFFEKMKPQKTKEENKKEEHSQEGKHITKKVKRVANSKTSEIKKEKRFLPKTGTISKKRINNF